MIAKMHDDEIDIDVGLVRRLLRSQFPRWADLPIDQVDSTGTVNAIFRLGAQLAVRLPRTPNWHDLDTELCWLDGLAPLLPAAIPEVIVRGVPDLGYPWPWAVFRWIDVCTWDPDDAGNSLAAADDIAGFLATMRTLDPLAHVCAPAELPRLAVNDDSVRSAARDAHGILDADAVLEGWERALRIADWQGQGVLLHGDFLAGNVLVRDRRLHAVIDWAGVRVGDPARDLIAAWTLFRGESRHRFCTAVDADDETWARARGWALTRITNVAYYATTNPRFAADAVATITEALADPA